MSNEKQFSGLKVFSATKAGDREILGEKITEWVAKNPEMSVVNTVITQSSDSEFHCLTITIFFQGKLTWNPAPAERVPRNDHNSNGRQSQRG